MSCLPEGATAPLFIFSFDMYQRRKIPNQPFPKIFLIVGTAVFVSLIAIEFHAKQRRLEPSRDLNMGFWQNHRFMLDDQAEDTTVLFGASRMTFGLDLKTWDEVTGETAYNLGMHGASSLPMLHDYARNTEGNGKVLCTISGGFTFAQPPIPFAARIKGAMKDLKKNRYSLALRSQHFTGKYLQGKFSALNPRVYSPVELLRESVRFPTRPNEIAWFHTPYSVLHTEENQDIYIDDLSDPYDMRQWDIMHQTALRYMERFEPRDLGEAISQINSDVALIDERGGEVIFVRFPVSRFFKEWENERFPRQDYWDKIILKTGCRGFHYLDHERTKNLFPPDGSHLMPKEARIFTRELARFVFEKKD